MPWGLGTLPASLPRRRLRQVLLTHEKGVGNRLASNPGPYAHCCHRIPVWVKGDFENAFFIFTSCDPFSRAFLLLFLFIITFAFPSFLVFWLVTNLVTLPALLCNAGKPWSEPNSCN